VKGTSNQHQLLSVTSGLDRGGAAGSRQSDASGSARPPFAGAFGRTASQGQNSTPSANRRPDSQLDPRVHLARKQLGIHHPDAQPTPQQTERTSDVRQSKGYSSQSASASKTRVTIPTLRADSSKGLQQPEVIITKVEKHQKQLRGEAGKHTWQLGIASANSDQKGMRRLS
jgi:hypothetical protein